MIRFYSAGDRAEWARMRTALWPDQTEADMADWLAQPDAVTVVAERDDGSLCGFAEIGERPWAEGCDTRPVAYVEGWYVDPDRRRSGVGRALLRAAEAWAVAHDYREMGSDALIENEVSRLAHLGAGFREVDRVVTFAKRLTRDSQ